VPAIPVRTARGARRARAGRCFPRGPPGPRAFFRKLLMIGITAYGGYVPRLRLSRQAAAQANAWYAPNFAGRKGSRAFANWDEDSITLAVAAARDCLGPVAQKDRSAVRG